MSSPEKSEVSDLQLSFVFGNSDVRPQKLHTPPEDAEPQELPEYCSTETLCLSRTNLNRVSESILKNSTLKVSLDCAFVNLCMEIIHASSRA